MNAQVGMKIEAYEGSCIGILIRSTTWVGEIVKVNRKSIRVRLTESTDKYGSKVTGHRENLCIEKTYRFVKTLSNGRACFRSDASLYGDIVL